jgi:hypothetical protein
MPRKRDTQRAKLYRAEHASGLRGEVFPSLMHVTDYVNRLRTSAWFKRTFGAHYIRVGDGRGGVNARAVGRSTIQLPLWARHEFTVLHEIAHLVRPVEGWAKGTAGLSITRGGVEYLGRPAEETHAWHGPQFAHTFLMLVRHKMGTEAERTLKAAFREHGVRYKAPRAPLSDERRAELAARLATLRAAKQPAVAPHPHRDVALARAHGC